MKPDSVPHPPGQAGIAADRIRSGADQVVVRKYELQEVAIIHETIACQVGRATGGHRRFGAIKNVVRDNEEDEVGIIDEAVRVEIRWSSFRSEGLG